MVVYVVKRGVWVCGMDEREVSTGAAFCPDPFAAGPQQEEWLCWEG
jgi:hypothetical protein